MSTERRQRERERERETESPPRTEGASRLTTTKEAISGNFGGQTT